MTTKLWTNWKADWLIRSFIVASFSLGALSVSIAGAAPPTLEDNDAERAATIERIGEEIEWLASPELEGRGVQTKGIVIAAEYIRDEFEKAGLVSGVEDGSYYQPFNVPIRNSISREKSRCVIRDPGGKEWELEVDSSFMPQQVGGNGSVSGDLVFVGYGINASDLEFQEYADLDVEGKIVVIMRNEPQQSDADSRFNGTELTEHSYILTKLTAAKVNNAAAILFVNDPAAYPNADEEELEPASQFGSRSMGIPFVQIKQSIVNEILAGSPLSDADGNKLDSLSKVQEAIDSTLQPISQPIDGWTAEIETVFETRQVETWNVIGVIEGEGPLADETIVVGGHYDHLGYGGYGSRAPGRNEIHPGADDNATGTVAVIELARRWAAMDEKPARRIVFIAFSGEERGLIGSRFYVDNPLFPLEDTVAMINFDMIGRLRQNALTLYGATSGVEFEEMCHAAAEGSDLELRIPPSGFAGSDHLPFYQRQIPDIFIHTGTTDVYHTPEDTFETINVPGTVDVIDFSDRLLKALVEMPKRPTFAEAQPRERRPTMSYLGAAPDFGSSEEGIYVRAVTDDSPAAKGGIKVGDVILSIAGTKVVDRNDLFSVLQENEAGTTVKVVVKRDDETVELEVTLGSQQGRSGRGRE